MKELIEDLRYLAGVIGDADGAMLCQAADAIESQAATITRYETTAENYELLQAKVDELEAWKAEELTVMNPLMDYARSACTGPLGCSITEWLFDDHKAMTAKVDEQAREIERLNSEAMYAAASYAAASEEIERLKAQPAGECVAVPDNKDNKINGFKDPVLYFADINDPDETGTDEPDFCDVVLAEDYDRNINALLALIPNLYREPRK